MFVFVIMITRNILRRSSPNEVFWLGSIKDLRYIAIYTANCHDLCYHYRRSKYVDSALLTEWPYSTARASSVVLNSNTLLDNDVADLFVLMSICVVVFPV